VVERLSRRDFLRQSAVVSFSALAGGSAGRVFAAGSDTIRAALIGCGERGTSNAIEFLRAADGVELVAMADIFQDQIDKSLEKMRKSDIGGKVKATNESMFCGFDGYKKVMASDVHAALIRSIREGKPINEGKDAAESTMTGIMGRISAYTGRALK